MRRLSLGPGGDPVSVALSTIITTGIEATPATSLLATLAWGMLSVFLSPCRLASVPLTVGLINRQGRIPIGRAFLVSTFFAVGILTTIALIGAITAFAGRVTGDMGAYANYVVAVAFLILGLYLLDAIPIPFLGLGENGMKHGAIMAAFILGLVFGLTLGPCTFAYTASLAGVTLSSGPRNLSHGMLLSLLYATGHGSVLVAVGTLTGFVQGRLRWHEESKGALVLRSICGTLVLMGGFYMICGPP